MPEYGIEELPLINYYGDQEGHVNVDSGVDHDAVAPYEWHVTEDGEVWAEDEGRRIVIGDLIRSFSVVWRIPGEAAKPWAVLCFGRHAPPGRPRSRRRRPA